MTLLSFRRMNPTWDIWLFRCKMPDQIKVWDTGEQQECISGSAIGNDYSDSIASLGIKTKVWRPACEILNPVHASDMFEWWYMAEVGGVYADMDILWIKPLDRIYQQYCDSDVWVTFWRVTKAIGFMAGSGDGNEFYRELGKMAASAIGDDYQMAGSWAIEHMIRRLAVDRQAFPWFNSQYRIEQVLQPSFPQYKITNVPMGTVYPFSWRQTKQIFDYKHVATTFGVNVCGVHWYAGDQLSQQMNGRLDSTNFRNAENDCLFTRLAASVLDGNGVSA